MENGFEIPGRDRGVAATYSRPLFDFATAALGRSAPGPVDKDIILAKVRT